MTRTIIRSPATVSIQPSGNATYHSGNITATARTETVSPARNTVIVTARYEAHVCRINGFWPGRALPVCQVQKCCVHAGKRR
jgi:hypothetical protein